MEKKLHPVKCHMCGKEFFTALPNRKYCSDLCRKAAEKTRRRAWKKANPGYDTEYARRRRNADQQ